MVGCRKSGLLVALVAAVTLVLQSISGALALGAGEGQVLLDAFGNPLCISSDADHSDSDTRHTLPACCALGCSTASAAFTPPPVQAAVAVIYVVVSRDPGTIVRVIDPDAGRGRDPGNPRAPPAMV